MTASTIEATITLSKKMMRKTKQKIRQVDHFLKIARDDSLLDSSSLYLESVSALDLCRPDTGYQRKKYRNNLCMKNNHKVVCKQSYMF